MSKPQEDFFTWFYRGFIGLLLSVTFLFVKSNYEDFNDMKKDAIKDKTEHAYMQQSITNINARLSSVEKIVK